MRPDYVSLSEVADVTKLAGFEFTKYINYNETGEIIALRALNLRHGELDLTDIKKSINQYQTCFLGANSTRETSF